MINHLRMTVLAAFLTCMRIAHMHSFRVFHLYGLFKNLQSKEPRIRSGIIMSSV